jgi:hypothetical protein
MKTLLMQFYKLQMMFNKKLKLMLRKLLLKLKMLQISLMKPTNHMKLQLKIWKMFPNQLFKKQLRLLLMMSSIKLLKSLLTQNWNLMKKNN